MGETERGYVTSFTTFRHGWGHRHGDAAVTTSLAVLDADLRTALDAMSEPDVADIADRRVRRMASLEKALHL